MLDIKFVKIIKNNLPQIFIFFFIAALFYCCEKDDICSAETQKTPLVKFAFRLSDSDNVKAVPFLQVGIKGAVSDSLLLPTTPTNSNEISLPLDTENNSTTFYFIKNAGQVDKNMISIQNIDTVEVVYTRRYDYVSRACGYKVTFEALFNSQTEFMDDDKWIEQIRVENSTIENSEEIHIIISH